jgi:hypothetical protein
MNLLTMTDKELIEHTSKQVQALRMALDMIECEKYDRRHVRWAIIDALKEESLPAAQRQWVGLTDEEIKPLCDENYIIYGAYTVDFIQSIEAKLKEKNTP